MGVLRVGVCLVAVCTLTADVRADLSPLFNGSGVMTWSALHADSGTADAHARGSSTCTLDDFSCIDSTFRFSSSALLRGEESASGPAFTIPPPPSSLKLFLSGMLAIGAWHGVKAGRQLAIGGLHVPEWYHDGGPAQIGHATPFDLTFASPPLRCFEQPVCERPFLYRVRRERVSPCDAQSTLIISAPRGPPAVSC